MTLAVARGPTPARGLAAALLVGLALRAGAARASAFEVLGFGPTGVAEVNARAARADDGSASFYNPGGLGLGQGYRVEVAPLYGISALEAQGKTQALDTPFGVAFAFDATVPFEGPLEGRVRFGFAGYFPPTTALHLVPRAATDAFFPYYDNRTQRLVVIPALAVRLFDRLGVGVGVNVLGGVSGPASVAPGASGAPESRIDVEAKTQLAVNAGLRFDPAPGAHLAAAFRQKFALPSLVTTSAQLGGVPLDVNVDLSQALFDPDTLVLASSFDVGRGTVEADASYAAWSAYQGPFVRVTAQLPGVNLTSRVPSGLARDVVSLRAAGSYRLDVGQRSELVLRAGGGFEPSLLTSVQQGRSNLVDGDKVLLGLGATLVLRDVLPTTVRLGAGVGAQVVLGYAQDKKTCAALPCPDDAVVGPSPAQPSAGITNPGYPRLEGHGAMGSMSLGVGVDL